MVHHVRLVGRVLRMRDDQRLIIFDDLVFVFIIFEIESWSLKLKVTKFLLVIHGLWLFEFLFFKLLLLNLKLHDFGIEWWFLLIWTLIKFLVLTLIVLAFYFDDISRRRRPLGLTFRLQIITFILRILSHYLVGIFNESVVLNMNLLLPFHHALLLIEIDLTLITMSLLESFVLQIIRAPL